MMNVEQAITHLRYRNVTNKERFTEAIDVLENEINRQKAEIERLQNELKITRQYIHENNLEYDLLAYSKGRSE